MNATVWFLVLAVSRMPKHPRLNVTFSRIIRLPVYCSSGITSQAFLDFGIHQFFFYQAGVWPRWHCFELPGPWWRSDPAALRSGHWAHGVSEQEQALWEAYVPLEVAHHSQRWLQCLQHKSRNGCYSHS